MNKGQLKKQQDMLKKWAHGAWKHILVFWFRRQSAIFLLLLVGISAFGMFMWYSYFYAFGNDEEKIKELIEQKQAFEFQEEMYETTRERLKERLEMRSREISDPQDLFITIPAELLEEE